MKIKCFELIPLHPKHIFLVAQEPVQSGVFCNAPGTVDKVVDFVDKVS